MKYTVSKDGLKWLVKKIREVSDKLDAVTTAQDYVLLKDTSTGKAMKLYANNGKLYYLADASTNAPDYITLNDIATGKTVKLYANGGKLYFV